MQGLFVHPLNKYQLSLHVRLHARHWDASKQGRNCARPCGDERRVLDWPSGHPCPTSEQNLLSPLCLFSREPHCTPPTSPQEPHKNERPEVKEHVSLQRAISVFHFRHSSLCCHPSSCGPMSCLPASEKAPDQRAHTVPELAARCPRSTHTQAHTHILWWSQAPL